MPVRSCGTSCVAGQPTKQLKLVQIWPQKVLAHSIARNNRCASALALQSSQQSEHSGHLPLPSSSCCVQQHRAQHTPSSHHHQLSSRQGTALQHRWCTRHALGSLQSRSWKTRVASSTNDNGTGDEASSPFVRAAQQPSATSHASHNSLPGRLLAKLHGKVTGLLADLDGLWTRFIPMSLLFFAMAFNNTVLDSVKDSLVITAKGGSAAVIPFITVYGVLPCSLLFLLAYSYATQRFKRQTVFNVVVGFFLTFFSLFALVYPMHERLHSHALAGVVAQALPTGLHGLVGMVRNWTYTLFYCFSELWGDVVLSLLFWGLANEITPMKDAPLLYPLFGVGANVAQVAAGRVLSVLARSADNSAQYVHNLRLLLMLVVALGVVSMVLHAYILRRFPRTHEGLSRKLQEKERKLLARQRTKSTGGNGNSVLTNGNGNGRAAAGEASLLNGSASADVLTRSGSRQEGPACLLPRDVPDSAASQKLTVREAFAFLAQSPQIRALALMAIAQGVCTNVLDLAWKSHLRMLHPSPAGYSAFMGEVAIATGVVTGVLMVLTPVLFRLWRWKGVASTTPRFMFAMGVPFFTGCIAFHAMLLKGGALTPASVAMLRLLVLAGAVLQVFGKGAKFSMFKPAEEMVYISLDSDISRTKGKAAIDVVGAQFGKSSGSILQQALLLATGGSVAGLLPFLCVIYLSMLLGWLNSVNLIAENHNPETHHAENNPSIPVTLLMESIDESDSPVPLGPASEPQPAKSGV